MTSPGLAGPRVIFSGPAHAKAQNCPRAHQQSSSSHEQPNLTDPCCNQENSSCGQWDSFDPGFANVIHRNVGQNVNYTGDRCVPKRTCYGVPSTQVACGAPQPSQCAGVPCSASPETIGDIFPGYQGRATTVVDVNGIWNQRGSASGGLTVGWMYKGSDGRYYTQPNFSNQVVWGGALSIPFRGMFSISATARGGYGMIRIYSGLLAPSSFFLKCESQGATFG